jgi:precorrin-6x reductase
MPEKLAAAREAGCTVVMVGRPDIDETAVCRDIDQIAARCQAELRGSEAP